MVSLLMWQRIERAVGAMNLGVELTPSDAALEPEFLEVFRECRHYSQTPKARMYALYKATEYVAKAGIPGDIVECGVWRGGSVMVVARALLACGQSDRRIFLYDTFEGMSKPSEADVWIKDGKAALPKWERRHSGHNGGAPKRYVGSVELVARNIQSTGYPVENLVFVQGKVEDTLPGTSPTTVALLRLDTDWYESTEHELTHLYPRLAKRGVLIIDDYGHWAGARKAVDEYFADRRPELLVRIDWSGRMAVKTDP